MVVRWAHRQVDSGCLESTRIISELKSEPHSNQAEAREMGETKGRQPEAAGYLHASQFQSADSQTHTSMYQQMPEGERRHGVHTFPGRRAG